MERRFLVAAAGAFAACALAAKECVWVGGAAEGNAMSIAANWQGNAAPENGDTLRFSGMNSAVVNDLSEEWTMKMIHFDNDGTEGKTAGFTITGNKIRLNDAIDNAPVAEGASITDTFDIEVHLVNNTYLGGQNASRHHMTFNAPVRGTGNMSTPNSGRDINTRSQHHGTITFNAPVTGFRKISRGNGTCTMVLNSAENEFTEYPMLHNIGQGGITVKTPLALGGGGQAENLRLVLGDQWWGPKWGNLNVDSDGDTTFKCDVDVQGFGLYDPKGGGAALVNMRAGTTTTWDGTFRAFSKAKVPGNGNGDGTGAYLRLGGAGDGVLAANVGEYPMGIWKDEGEGTWRICGEIAATGAVKAAAGTLKIDSDLRSMGEVLVTAGGTLAGTGKVSRLKFVNGSAFRLYPDAEGRLGAMEAAGELRLEGVATIDVEGVESLREGTYEILKYGAKSGAGGLALAEAIAGKCELQDAAGSLRLVALPEGGAEGTTRTWTGKIDSKWDHATANWTGEELFADGDAVKFIAGEGVRSVVALDGEVKPRSVTVANGGEEPFVISGLGKITGTAGLTKIGAGAFELCTHNGYALPTVVEEGAMTLKGSISNSSLRVAAGAAFTNAPGSMIRGDATVWLQGTGCRLDGTNDFTGELLMEGAAVEIGDPEALGKGLVTSRSSVLLTKSGETGSGRKLVLEFAGNYALKAANNVKFAWRGDVESTRALNFYANNGQSALEFGTAGGGNTFTADSVYARGNGQYHWRARIKTVNGFAQTDSNTHYLYVPGNEWNGMEFQVGKAVCCAEGVLAKAPVVLGQRYQDIDFHPVLDLNGFDQTISSIRADPKSLDVSSQTVKSAEPATLTVESDADSVSERVQLKFAGKLSLRKRGAGTWTSHAKNEAEGNLTVEGGVFKCAVADAVPAWREARLTVAEGAKFEAAEGLEAQIAYATFGTREMPAGLYGGPECAVAGAKRTEYLQGAGTLRVTRGDGRFILIIR